MQITKAEKVRLGIFVFTTLALVSIILFYMVGKRLITKMDGYTIKFTESVDGLMPGANVKLNGVNIGRVKKLEVDKTDVRKVVVSIIVTHGTPIKKDMEANLVGGLSITGIKNIELTGGTHGAENLPVGSEIPQGISQLKILTGQAEAIALKFETLLNNLLSFTSDENQVLVHRGLQSFNRLTYQIDTLVDNNASVIVSLARTSDESMQQFKKVAQKLDHILNDFQKREPGKKLGETLEEFHGIATEARSQISGIKFNKTLEDFGKVADQISILAEKMDQTINLIQEDITATMKNLKETSENMEDFSRLIKDNPSLLLRTGDKRERER